jgi:acyl transferase domain-containing protein
MTERRNLLQESLAAIERLQARLEASENARHEPIAIVGAGCRYPGDAETLDGLWRVLRDGVDAITEVPAARWDASAIYDPDFKAVGKSVSKWGGFLSQIDRFDPFFFGISPREAATLDPQQRLLLETSCEALESAGIAADRLVGSATGVFVGITTSDYGQIVRQGGADHADVYSATGSALNAAAGRIAFSFGFQGPCVAVDTACSSSLVAVHLACQSLRTRECDLALAGGVNVILSPEAVMLFSRWGMMAPDGRCKTFDAAANGFVRSEGCAVIALKRLAAARADGDPVLAVIRGSAVNSDGRSSGLTVPNGPAQEAVLRSALASARLAATDIDYVEAHGTGTSLGDPIEVEALGAVMCAERPSERPLLVGSVKTNIGHTEAASGLAGLLKVVLSLTHEAIPPHLHFSRPSPAIAWDALSLKVPTELTPWRRGDRPRRAGVSSFGFSGTNAHVVLEEAPARARTGAVDSPHALHLLPLSARTEAALKATARAWASHLTTVPQASLADVCLTAGAGRSHYGHRLALRAGSVEGARDALQRWCNDQEVDALNAAEVTRVPRIAFLFTGQGAQYAGMGKGLYEAEPVFRAVLDRCAQLLEPLLPRPLLEVLYPVQGEEAALSNTAFTQPALFALEYALAELWKSWGITPSVVLGHSVGEYTAACVAGVMSLETAIPLIAERARLMQALPRDGAMAAVFSAPERLAPFLAKAGPWISVAAINGPDRVVLSGRRTELDALVGELGAAGIRCQPLSVSHAFHSALLDPMLDGLEAAAQQIRFAPPRLTVISNLTGEPLSQDTPVDARYWRRHAREPVRFADSVRAALAAGCDTFVELGPSPTLISMVADIGGSGDAVLLASLRKGRDDRQEMLTSVGALYVRGANVNWAGLATSTSALRIPMPTYPFQRERHWVKLAARGAHTKPPSTAGQGHPMLGRPRVDLAASDIRIWEGTIDLATYPYLADHQVQRRVIVPATAYLEMVVAAESEAFGPRPLVLSGMKLHAPLALDADTRALTQTILSIEADGTRAFAVYSRKVDTQDEGPAAWTKHLTGRVTEEERAALSKVDLGEVRERCGTHVTGEAFYRALAARGNEWGPCFRGLAQVWHGVDEAVAEVSVPSSLADTHRYRFHPALADASGHVLAATIPLAANGGPMGGAFVGGALDRFVFRRSPKGRLWAHARRRHEGAPANVLEGDVRLVDETGEVVAEVQGARLWYLAPGIDNSIEESLPRRMYAIEWRAKPIEPAQGVPTESGKWLIFSDRAGIGRATLRRLAANGSCGVIVEPGDCFQQVDPERFLVRPGSREDLRRLIGQALASATCAGVVHLWSLDAPPDDHANAAELEQSALLACTSLVALVKELAADPHYNRTRLWLVTRGTQACSRGEGSSGAAGGTIWGLGRTLAVEHVDLWGGLIDLDVASTPDDAAAMLAREIAARDGEDQVAFRDGERHVARLVRIGPSQTGTGVRWRLDASYLITGGLGGLGLRVAQWMVEQGARRIVLLARSGLPPRREWNATDASSQAGRRITAIRRLESMGASVHVAMVDVTDENGLREFAESFKREGWPTIRGIVHAAGTVQYGPLVNATNEQLREVLRPKVAGGWLLHRIFASVPLDFFVLFSSASGVLSSPMVGAYAAANAFLDALAHHRAARGQPALSIDWGLWTGAGMAESVDAASLATLTARGMGSLAPEQALEALGVLLGTNHSQAAVIPVNWPVWLERYPMFTAAPFLSEISAGVPSTRATSSGSTTTRESILALPVEERVPEVLGRLRLHAAAVLQVDPSLLDARKPLISFGIDSLMAVELKNRIDRDLGLSVPLVHYLDGSGLGHLVEVLLTSVPDPVGDSALGNEHELLTRLPDMSEEEVDQLLEKMLAEGTGS